MIYKCEVQYTIVQEKNFTRKTLYCHADENFMIPNNFNLTKAIHLDFQELIIQSCSHILNALQTEE